MYLNLNLVNFYDFELVSFNSMVISMSLFIDWVSMIFISFVFMISSMVIYYSSYYMGMDMNLNRFVMLVVLFVISMLLLIISPNMVSILLGWDGLGLVSYCLVIYYQNVKSYNAGMVTILTNRLGDVALLMVISWMVSFGSWNFSNFYNGFSESMEIISGLVIIAAMTKSAQIPFSSWLPAAMAAPTPVSALVHSSTLVTAGVYLLIRFNYLLNNLLMMEILLILSSITMFMAGIGANYEFDLKKIIALSTLSQLGLMMGVLMIGYYDLAFFHLLMHALFKALMFMCAGLIIHSMNNCQDIRLMGSMSFMMPMTTSILNVANLALCGMPFLAGFYSKDLILEMICMDSINCLVFFLYFISTGLTVCYSFRLSYYLMIKSFSFYSMNCLVSEDWSNLVTLFFLMMLSIFGGSMISWLIFQVPMVVILPLNLKMLVLCVIVLGLGVGLVVNWISLFMLNKSYYLYFISSIFGDMWFMPKVFSYGMVNMFLFTGKYLMYFDSNWLEYFGSKNFSKKLVLFTSFIQFLFNNSFSIYLLSFMVWFIFILVLI
uniref:NADH-ubiquinone oxidoreductase chain 5 n=1 Tax=Paradyschiria parvula TaxID=2572155 RepID=A0A5B9RFL4_9MUSC|nr:NADH dehydrogenase subunit 5 [Paradyschiria parvula]QEG77638.1 NADH dehydrogenase subunit 5 [Paradyschiria parvula]